MEEKRLVPAKLNFLQQLRKSFYLIRMNEKNALKYTSLPDYLKLDNEVVDAVVTVRNSMIVNIPFEKADSVLAKKPELIIHFGDIRIIEQHLIKHPELITYLEQDDRTNDIYSLIYKEIYKEPAGNKEFIQYLSKEKQVELLTERPSYRDCLVEASGSFWDRPEKKGRPEYLKNSIDKFSEEAILEAAIRESLRVQRDIKRGVISVIDNQLLLFDLKSLPIKTQIKLAIISEDFLHKISEEALLSYANGNPLLFEKFPKEIKCKIVETNPEVLSKMPIQFQLEYVKQNPIAFRNASPTGHFRFDVKVFKTSEEAIKRLTLMNLGAYRQDDYDEIINLGDNDFVWRMAQYDPKCMSCGVDTSHHIIRNKDIVNNLYIHAREYDAEGVLTQFLAKYDLSYEIATAKKVEIFNRIGKMLVNDDIMSVVSGEEVLDYAKNPTHEKLVEIIRKTYGDKSARILEDRPQLTSEYIPNFYLFKPEIVEEFGIGAIHANLSFEMSTSGVLSELARNPEQMRRYKYFNKATEGFFPDTAIGLDSKLRSFVELSELVGTQDFRSLTEAQRKNLEIVILDRSNKNAPDVIDVPRNMQELNTYVERRKALYDDAITKQSNPEVLKQCISKRFFGLDYSIDKHHLSLDAPDVWSMCNFYNLDTFVNDAITLQSGNFSTDELDLLELLEVFRKVDNPNILRELAQKMTEREDIITPMNFKELRSKVPQQYTQEMVDQIITPDKAKEMVERGVEGIEVREEDGITIYFLKGVDFKAYVSNPFMDNSGIGTISREALAKEWREKENGISTISGTLIDQDEPTSCIGRGEYGIGFGKINSNQIIGMGNTDIHASHIRRQLYNSTTEAIAVSYDYPEELMRKTERRVRKIEDPYNDPNHLYDEVSSLRTQAKLSEIEEGTYGGKIIPDYIFSNGTEYGAAKNAAKEMGIKTLFVFDESRYRDRRASRAFKEAPTNTPRPETEFMAQVKRIAKGEDFDGR